jgi:hypothetical protein
MVCPGKEKKISAPAVADVHQCHVLRRPGIQTVEVFGRLDRPFLNIADDISCRNRRLQSQSSEAFADRQYLVERHWRVSFPAALTHVVSPLEAIYRPGRTARWEIVVSAR